MSNINMHDEEWARQEEELLSRVIEDVANWVEDMEAKHVGAVGIMILLSRWIDLVQERLEQGTKEGSALEKDLADTLVNEYDVSIEFLRGALHYLGDDIPFNFSFVSKERADVLVREVRNMWGEPSPVTVHEKDFVHGAEYASDLE